MESSAAPLPTALAELAVDCGVLVAYVDHGGVRRLAGQDSLVAALEALGEPDAGRDPERVLAERRARQSLEILEPAVVVVQGQASVAVTPPARSRKLECRLATEDGQVLEWTVAVDELGGDTARQPPGRARSRRSLTLPIELDPGYHSLTVRTSKAEARTHVLAKPTRGARGRFDSTWRAVGIATPLFSLHSARSWGCGDLTDLDELAAFASRHGTSVIATLPLLAGFGPAPFEPSPYLPVSRLFWHERWIDVEAEFDATTPPGLVARASELKRSARVAASRSHPFVDGAHSMSIKRDVLGELLRSLHDSGSARLGELEAFLAERPQVVDYARFRAVGDRLGIDWHRWPSRLRDGSIEAGDVEASAVEQYCFSQMLAQRQLSRVAARCEERGQVLSLDLPLGAHSLGYDGWRHRDQFVEHLSVGAPPDRFFPGGQWWGFPPPRFDASQATGHALFRAALEHHLRVAGMLRIDHVLGLQRLFCIPDGATPAQGVYVRAPLDELLAVVAIEAERHHGSIVGEDLGTVDSAVRRAMDHDGIRRSFAVVLSVGRTGPLFEAAVPPGSAASFTTHDLPTFDGWWRSVDIDERLTYGQIDEAGATAMREQRDLERAALMSATLRPVTTSNLPDEPPPGLLGATLDALTQSDAGLIVAQLGDLVGERDAVNLPGTSVERPNWQYRIDPPLESLEADASVVGALDELHARRPIELQPEPTQLGSHEGTDFSVTRFGDLDEHLFNEGRHARLYDQLGAHEMEVDGRRGTYFAVWAPNAAWVEVIGDFNGWDGRQHPLARHEDTGVWEGFIGGVGLGERYKFKLASTLGGEPFDKADPFATRSELAPGTASITAELRHTWGDEMWMAGRAARHRVDQPISIYELHLGSWARRVEEGGRPLTYTEIAPLLIEHVHAHGFTHVELLPVSEHPFYGSWGYHVTGFFAPTARYGEPDEFAALVDLLHQAGIGVLLDWVPAHFPSDAFALATFDGTHLFEHADPKQGVHPDWDSLIFNYGRNEVRSFLLSAACSWLDRYHVDGLRFDAVASMLYLDYSREPGEWVPNQYGGRENLEAVEFLQTCNEELHRAFPDAITVAEESTSWPGVTAPTTAGGLGFDYKWDLGWMHDTLDYLAKDPIHRSFHHELLTFRSVYAYSEQFILPLSHDEVVHGKGSLLDQMPGDDWQRFANVRLLLGYQFVQPGKKLLFMGDEFAQHAEWSHERSLDWHLLERHEHRGIAALVSRLNELYRSEAALHRDDLDDRGFSWISGDDRGQSVACIERHDDGSSMLVALLNATPEPRHDYLVGMPAPGTWTLLVDSDAIEFGGSGHRVCESVETTPEPLHGKADRASLILPPLGFVIYARR
jgi:alpha-1,4-glucan:alpha-1,4-glucan 6-glycosyltransferase/4-alpha-glucanotransferase